MRGTDEKCPEKPTLGQRDTAAMAPVLTASCCTLDTPILLPAGGLPQAAHVCKENNLALGFPQVA